MDLYKLFLLFLMMILAVAQDFVADSSPAGASITTATNTIVGSFGSELYSMIETVTSTHVPTGVASDDGLQLAKSTVFSTSIVYVSYTTIVATTVQSPSTSTDIITFNLTTTQLSQVTAVTTVSTQTSSTATGLCYLAAQDALTPCTAAVMASPTSSASHTSGVMRHTPNGLFKNLASLKRRVFGTNHHQKREPSCSGWNAAIIITALSIAFTLVSILFFTTLCRDKREELPRVYAYRWWIYGAQVALLALLVWLIVWSAIKTVGNGCN
ncbi:hypothetical protein SBOR_0159 [Sclerotinia borealis F-4128]|uniref:Uncharacterized protein n=1 Tax=Sclerotinia borealis (strain F-4128) TaxID=1432307 RepID=W9CRI0_SCLBF|nr:hypothetical protein SBOR_0159 [Sclerotinia borealis F-4128]